MQPVITIAANIARLRKENSLTQEELARFLGVTKASVSKWECGQSCPDIELLARIASYFDISIDALVGYEPQLSKREIREQCARLRTLLAEQPFEQAHAECRKVAHEYYACYPLLAQIAALYLNHMAQAPESERSALTQEAMDLCRRVRAHSTSSLHVKQAETTEAMLLLSSGDAWGVIDLLADAALEDFGSDIPLARAYCALGQADKADETLQAALFQGLVLSLNRLQELALLHVSDRERLDVTHERAAALIAAFDLENVFVNVAAIHFAFATAYSMIGEADSAIACLEDYERSCRALEFPAKIHGDAFFDKIESWAEEVNDIGTDAPRDEAVIKQSMLAGVSANPAFAPLADDPRFKRIVKSLEEITR